MTEEELSHRRGRRPKSGVVMVKEKRSGKHKCRRITKWKDNKEEGTITFITNDFETPADVLCEVYRRRWQIETLQASEAEFPAEVLPRRQSERHPNTDMGVSHSMAADAGRQEPGYAQVEPVEHDGRYQDTAHLIHRPA
jgi:hypothetical protein